MSLNLMGMQSVAAMTGGIDYASIISQLVQAARAPGDALNQYIQTDELKKSDWTNINNLAGQLQTALGNLAQASTFTSYSATSANTAVVNATSGTNAVPGTYQITVNSLGSNSTFTSSAQIGGAVTTSTPLSATDFSQPVTSGNFLLTVGTAAVKVAVNPSTDTISSVQTSINNALAAAGISGSITLGVSGDKLVVTNGTTQQVTLGSAGDSTNFLSVMGVNGQQVTANSSYTSQQVLGHVQTGTTLSSASANFATAVTATTTGVMSINGVQINYNTSTDTLNSVITAINNSSAGVTASYDPIGDKVVLTSNTSQPITVSDVSGNLAQALNLRGTSTAGTNWNYTLNGATMSSTSATVTNAIPGVTLTLGTTTGTQTTVTVTQSSDNLSKNLDAFISAFNSLYTQLHNYTKYQGDLQGDMTASQLGYQLMNDVLSNVPNTSQYPNQSVVGIGLSDNPNVSPGIPDSLVLDKTKLLSAFQSNPAEVQALLQGVAKRLDTALVNITGNFDSLVPYSSQYQNFTSLAQSQQNMYSSDISNIQAQQQNIYNQANNEGQQLQQQFAQLQQYMQTIGGQQQAMSAIGL